MRGTCVRDLRLLNLCKGDLVILVGRQNADTQQSADHGENCEFDPNSLDHARLLDAELFGEGAKIPSYDDLFAIV